MDRLTTVQGLRCFHVLEALGYGSCNDYCNIHGYCMDCEIRLAFKRLAAYEDTGLTPEEIIKMKTLLETENPHIRCFKDTIYEAVMKGETSDE